MKYGIMTPLLTNPELGEYEIIDCNLTYNLPGPGSELHIKYIYKDNTIEFIFKDSVLSYRMAPLLHLHKYISIYNIDDHISKQFPNRIFPLYEITGKSAYLEWLLSAGSDVMMTERDINEVKHFIFADDDIYIEVLSTENPMIKGLN